jgi:hypothetical protein
MAKFSKPGSPAPESKPPKHGFTETSEWPFPPGFEVRAFALEHRQPGRLLRLATFVMRDGLVDRVEYSPDNMEAVVGGQGYTSLEDTRIRINENLYPGLPRKD